jgi:hypothetical protein
MIDIQAKLDAVAEILDGRVIDGTESGLAVCVKGSVLGFPATLQAISPGWPFGVMFVIETEIVVDPNSARHDNPLQMIVYPRVGRGFFGFFSHILLFESRGMSVKDKRLESKFIFSHNDENLAERFVKYPGVSERLSQLEDYAKFNELTIKSDAGIVLNHPKSFQAMDLDVCRTTFKSLGELGQVLFESY